MFVTVEHYVRAEISVLLIVTNGVLPISKKQVSIYFGVTEKQQDKEVHGHEDLFLKEKVSTELWDFIIEDKMKEDEEDFISFVREVSMFVYLVTKESL